MTVAMSETLRAWGGDDFDGMLKQEIAALPAGTLPLNQGTSQGGYVEDTNIEITVLNTTADAGSVQARVGVFFTEVVPSCSCGDEPLEVNAYCVVLIRIDKATAMATFAVEPDMPGA
jgi:hypothetical protein